MDRAQVDGVSLDFTVKRYIDSFIIYFNNIPFQITAEKETADLAVSLIHDNAEVVQLYNERKTQIADIEVNSLSLLSLFTRSTLLKHIFFSLPPLSSANTCYLSVFSSRFHVVHNTNNMDICFC